MKIGLAIQLNENEALEPKLEEAVRAGFDTIQLALWDMSRASEADAAETRALLDKHGLAISELWCGWEGPAEWDFIAGPATLGLVPPAYRGMRLQNLLAGVRYAKVLGVSTLITHLGFLPTDPASPDYVGVVQAVNHLLEALKENGMRFLMETGQEVPLTLVRLMEDVKLDNIGINFDPSNLMLYGNANPMDALTMLGSRVECFHAKDGKYPTGGRELGEEKPLGEGDVNIAALVGKLKEMAYKGYLIIENERECGTELRYSEIVAARKLLEGLVN